MPGRGGRNRWQGGRRRHGDACVHKASSLLDCPARSWAEIGFIAEDCSCAQRLRELGALDGVKVYIIKRSDPMLILVGDTRIAIDRETAARIIVHRTNQP